MPLSHGNAEAADVAACLNKDGVGKLTLIIVIEPLHLATEHHDGLRGVLMAMDGHHRAGLQGVQHALALVGRGVTQVEVHPQARGGFGLSSQGVEEFLINQHLKCRVESLESVGSLGLKVIE